jgi:hypothetical protein
VIGFAKNPRFVEMSETVLGLAECAYAVDVLDKGDSAHASGRHYATANSSTRRIQVGVGHRCRLDDHAVLLLGVPGLRAPVLGRLRVLLQFLRHQRETTRAAQPQRQRRLRHADLPRQRRRARCVGGALDHPQLELPGARQATRLLRPRRRWMSQFAPPRGGVHPSGREKEPRPARASPDQGLRGSPIQAATTLTPGADRPHPSRPEPGSGFPVGPSRESLPHPPRHGGRSASTACASAIEPASLPNNP